MRSPGLSTLAKRVYLFASFEKSSELSNRLGVAELEVFVDLRQLRYFVGIVQAGSLARAAAQLHVAQSALSHHLARLEAGLERQLVTRGPKGIQLTEAGSVLYRHAEGILRHVESARQEVSSKPNIPSGRVSIGLPHTIAAILSYELFLRVRSAYPQIVLHINDGNNALSRERLVNGRLDIAVLFADRHERGLTVEPLLLEELFYVTADPDTSPIRIPDAAQRPLLVPGPTSASRRVAQEAFNRYGLTITSIGEIETLSALRRAIASGIGNGILSWSALYDGDEKTVLNYRRFADAKLVRTVALCFSEVTQRSPAIDAVALALKSLVHELVESGTWQGVSLITSSEELSHSVAPQ
jgi:LysR family transcriptional regulator, nitrogen assimilation regulatory protein